MLWDVHKKKSSNVLRRICRPTWDNIRWAKRKGKPYSVTTCLRDKAHGSSCRLVYSVFTTILDYSYHHDVEWQSRAGDVAIFSRSACASMQWCVMRGFYSLEERWHLRGDLGYGGIEDHISVCMLNRRAGGRRPTQQACWSSDSHFLLRCHARLSWQNVSWLWPS